MGNKRITEKDFWQCTNGAVPAQLQGTNTTTKKISEEKYITIQDKATSSWIDFGCTKLMLIYALLAAAAIVVGAMIIGTGGAALIAIGAIAGLAGAAWGAVVGTMLCGHMGVKIRDWIPVPKAKQTLIQGQEQITGDYKMTCMIPGGIVTFAPQIKNWSQAISLGASNYLGKLMEGMMAGAAVGMGGALISGGTAAFTSGGIRGIGQAALQFAKSMPKNFVVNAVESVGKFGLAMRGVMGVQNTAATYGNTGSASLSDFKDGVISMETGAIDSAKLIYSDMTGGVILNEKGEPKHAGWQDYLGMVMMFAPVGQGKRDLENSLKNEPESVGSIADDAESKKADEEDGGPKAEVQENSNSTLGETAEAYEARLGDRRISDDLYNELRDQTPTQDIRNMVNEGIILPMPDFALPGLEITKRLHADHIVPMDKITKMEGFDLLTKDQQLQVLNNPDNFTGLSPSANTSKGPKSFEEWTEHKSRGIQVDPVFREEMIVREQQLQGQLQQQIDNLLRISD